MPKRQFNWLFVLLFWHRFGIVKIAFMAIFHRGCYIISMLVNTITTPDNFKIKMLKCKIGYHYTIDELQNGKWVRIGYSYFYSYDINVMLEDYEKRLNIIRQGREILQPKRLF